MSFVYQPGIPTGAFNLDQDYLNVQGNFQQANIVYGTDHYPFNNATPNQGFHNQVTTPIYVANPVTGLPPVTAANPIFYAFQQTAPLGVLQYSRGPTNTTPSPVTNIYSQATGITLVNGAPINILDCSGLARATFELFVSYVNTISINGGSFYIINWTGSAFVFQTVTTAPSGSPALVISNSGNIIQLSNSTGAANFTNLFWTLKLVRLQ